MLNSALAILNEPEEFVCHNCEAVNVVDGDSPDTSDGYDVVRKVAGVFNRDDHVAIMNGEFYGHNGIVRDAFNVGASDKPAHSVEIVTGLCRGKTAIIRDEWLRHE